MRYGKRDFAADGSYTTTLWFVFFYVPVFPIKSERLLPTGEVKYYLMRSRQTVLSKGKIELHLKQVISTYAWWAAELALFITAKLRGSWWIALPGLVLLVVPVWLRRRASEAAKSAAAREGMGFSTELSE